MVLSALSRILLLALALVSSANWVQDAAHQILRGEAAAKLVPNVQLNTFPASSTPPFDIQAHGTTTLAFRHNDSIIVCVDSKASMGNYVGSRTVKKVFPVAPRIVATMAGGAADCAYWIRAISTQAKVLERKYDTPMRTQGIARLLSRQLRAYRGRGNSTLWERGELDFLRAALLASLYRLPRVHLADFRLVDRNDDCWP